jgi:hypothetical protein
MKKAIHLKFKKKKKEEKKRKKKRKRNALPESTPFLKNGRLTSKASPF